MSDDAALPEPWATWAFRAGVRPSRTGIGEAAGVPASTISRLLKGRTTERTVKAVSDALQVSSKDVLAAATGDSQGPWTPPLEAHLLHDDEREALGLLIQRLTAGREGGTDAGTAEAPKKSEPGDPPGNVTAVDFGAPADSDLRTPTDPGEVPAWADEEAANDISEPKGRAYDNQSGDRSKDDLW